MNGQPTSTSDAAESAIEPQAAQTPAQLICESDDKRRASARDVVADAAEILGGAKALAKWVEADDKNREKFWTTLYPKLIPLELTGESGGPIRVAAVIEAARKRVRDGRQADSEREGDA